MPSAPKATIADLAPGESGVVQEIGGDRAFRRRLMELGLLPGVEVTLRKVAPLGDPLELGVRRGSISIRRREAAVITIDRELPVASAESFEV